MLKKFRLYKEEKGIAFVWFAIFFVVIVFIMGLAIDGGRLYKTRIELRKVANATALSGAQELPIGEDKVQLIANNILKEHGEESSLKNLVTTGKSKLTVTLEKKVPLFFMRIFNINDSTVSVASSAAIVPLTRAVGAVPFGIRDDAPLVVNQEYVLKVDSGDSITGNFGILALSGVGANNYEQDLRNGYNEVLEVGDVVLTQTGNVQTKTVDGVNYRIDESRKLGYSDGDTSHRDDPRIVMILVYKPYEWSVNQMKSVEICGFAYFYLTEPLDKHDSTVRGYFIEKTGTGSGSVTAENNGAYAIRLVE